MFYSDYLQIVVWKFLQRSKGSEVLATKQALLHVVLFQYIPRFARFFPLNTELKKTAGVFAESALLGAAYYLLWYMLSSHVSISVIDRIDKEFKEHDMKNGTCEVLNG